MGLNPICGRLNNEPKDIHVLIPGICECYFTYQGDFVSVIKLIQGNYPELSVWALNVIIFIKGKQRKIEL